jgi:hypothetical protein
MLVTKSLAANAPSRNVRTAFRRAFPEHAANMRQAPSGLAFSVFKVDVAVTDPGQHTLVAFCKYWHSGR